MYNNAQDIVIDAALYGKLTDYLRQMHGLTKDEKQPANETTKQILIEDAREEYLRFKDKQYHSHLRNLISAMVNSEGFKYNLDQVWNMKIYAFMDSVKRIAKIKNAGLLLESGYSGFGTVSYTHLTSVSAEYTACRNLVTPNTSATNIT